MYTPLFLLGGEEVSMPSYISMKFPLSNFLFTELDHQKLLTDLEVCVDMLLQELVLPGLKGSEADRALGQHMVINMLQEQRVVSSGLLNKR